MASKVCFVYPWATFGGVERVLLNRLTAFRTATLDLQVELVFLHDAGGLPALRDYIHRHGLSAGVRIDPDFAPAAGDHDLVFCIDAPQAIDACHRRQVPYVVECHTSYADNRRYLRHLPASCLAVLTPSALFSERIRGELRASHASLLSELRNFVPWDSHPPTDAVRFPAWARRPLLYFGRLDAFKNPLALLDAFQHIEARRPGEFMPVFCGPTSAEIDLPREIHRRGLTAHCVVLPAIPFASAAALFDMLAAARGVFVSPSQGESFGLSAAEALGAGVPVVLSDLEEHRFLVHGHEHRFTYRQGQPGDLADQALQVLDDHERAAQAACELRERFSTAVFLQDWQALMQRLESAPWEPAAGREEPTETSTAAGRQG